MGSKLCMASAIVLMTRRRGTAPSSTEISLYRANTVGAEAEH